MIESIVEWSIRNPDARDPGRDRAGGRGCSRGRTHATVARAEPDQPPSRYPTNDTAWISDEPGNNLVTAHASAMSSVVSTLRLITNSCSIL
jgi:hypothetical protein